MNQHPRLRLALLLALPLLLSGLSLGCDDPPEGSDGGVRVDASGADAGGGTDGGGTDGGGGGEADAGPMDEDAGMESTVARYVSLSSGERFSCAARDDGRVLCWGFNDNGRLGRGGLDLLFHPEASLVLREGGSPLVGVTDVAAGSGHACARVLTGGTGRVFCWGKNDSMQIGAPGTSGDQLAPTGVAFEDGSPLTGVAEVATGGAHSCALTESGEAFCWGNGTNGQIGRGEAMGVNEVVQVIGEDGTGNLEGATVISALGDSSCTLLSSSPNTPFCWGRATSCGTPATAPRVLLSFGGPLTDTAPGFGFTCGLRADGGVRCAGENASGQLGDGSPGSCSVASREVLAPSGAGPLTEASLLTVGRAHSCAGTADGVVCWGLGAGGRLGDGDETDSARPPALVLGEGGAGTLPAPALLAAGHTHTCAVLRPSDPTVDDTIYCWGEDYGAIPAEVMVE